ncbi:hypothetical protein NLJ89_g7488 [Agrocybe chaxingu]|uniref:TEA domain-containing protein n=1 Tax=Agrocybe chaxingu TaxID=84603 RepID=A0A9W8JUH4_9AGAR|nr:hypothetical protein NLJ89_g7488 [Agrocybe chaxingu]
MPYTDWQSTSSSKAKGKQEYGFVCMSTTVDDLSYTPSEEEKSRDAAQILATGRRSWKTLRGKGEAVWPPLLEAALLEALEKYQPETIGSKSTKTLGRFPMRNKFISDYIFEITGKRRTPKQVGSRLQQLRDTCKGDKILNLISHRGTPETTSVSSTSECSPAASPSPSLSPSPDPRPSGSNSPQTIVYVDIALQNEMWPTPIPSVHFVANDSTTPQLIQLSPSLSASNALLPPGASSLLSSMCPSVEFPSHTGLALQSTFIVYMNGSNSPIHTEVAPLKCISSPMQRSGWLYSTDLVPSFWPVLCSCQDVSQYTILQKLRPIPAQSSVPSEAQSQTRNISVVYKFVLPPPPPRRQSDVLPATYPLEYSTGPSMRASSMPPSQLTLPTPSNSQQYGYQWQTPRHPGNTKNDGLPLISTASYSGDPSFSPDFSSVNSESLLTPISPYQPRISQLQKSSQHGVKYEAGQHLCAPLDGQYYSNYSLQVDSNPAFWSSVPTSFSTANFGHSY